MYALSVSGASSESARLLAENENKVDMLFGNVSLDDKDEMVKQVLLDLSLTGTIQSSLDIGDELLNELTRVGRVHKKKVQQAGFAVLKTPNIPAVLLETAFISNPSEEKKLRDKGYQGRLSNSILAGIRGYFYTNPPPDTQIAMDLKRAPARQIRHVVARGDTVSEIAQRYNVRAADIRRANKLSSDKIRIGQTLSIPVFAGG